MARCVDEFTNHLTDTGYTLEEATSKVRAVNEAYKVGSPTSKWEPAQIAIDPRGGFKVTIQTKD